MAKWVASIDRADRIPELVSHAYHVAMSGRRGPVVLALPEDMLVQQVAVRRCGAVPGRASRIPARRTSLALRAMLAAAERPFVMPGGSGWSAQAVADLRTFAEANDLPVGLRIPVPGLCSTTAIRTTPATSASASIPRLAQRVKDADL